MKRFLLSVLGLLISATAFAAGGTPLFADMKWGSNVAAVRAQLSEKGFETEIDGDGDVKFTGKLMGYPMGGWAFMVSKRLLKVQVLLLTADDKARDAYGQMKGVLSGKYGAPSNTYEFFQKPYYEGDGYEETAIKVGKGTFACFWGSSLSLEITKKLTVQVNYESPEWSTELARRRNRGSEVF